MNLELINSIKQLEKIEFQWEELLLKSQSNDFFLQPKYFFAWWSVFGKNKELFFIALWDKKVLRALFPLYKKKKGPFVLINFAGQPRHSDRMDFILDPLYEHECLKQFAHWIFTQKNWDLLNLKNFGPFTKNPEKLYNIFEQMGKKSIKALEKISCYIDTEKYKTYDNYLKKVRSARTRQKLRSYKRKLNSYRHTEWEILNNLGKKLIDEMEELELKKSFRGKNNLCFFNGPLNKKFLIKLTKNFQNTKMIELLALRINGELCAYQFNFNYNNSCMVYQTAFNMKFAKLSAGIVTQLESINHIFKNGYKEYDFLNGSELYKYDWTDDFRQERRLLVYNDGLLSLLIYIYHKKIKPLRRMLKNNKFIEKFLIKILSPELIAKLDI